MSGYQTGDGNQLLSDGTYTYTYSHNGQLTTKTDANGNTWTYSWDQRGRLVEVVETDSNGNVVSDEKLTYDIHNNLIGTRLNGTPQQWTVWDGKNPYLQFGGSGQLTERYITDPSTLDHFFAQVGANGAVEWLLTDKQGSVRAIVDDSGTMLDQLTYDAYGNILAQTDAAQASAYLFQGGYYDSTLGLYRFGARWYDTHNGRWLSEDPLGLLPDSDPYRFVSNSPTNFTDPSGELVGLVLLVGVGIYAGVVAGYSAYESYQTGADFTDLAGAGFGASVDTGAMVLNAGTFHLVTPLNDHVNDLIEQNGGLYPAANVFAHIGTYALEAAGAVWLFQLATGQTILVEGVLGGGRMGSGGLFQLRPQGGAPWIRFDYHALRQGGCRLPHIDFNAWGIRHFPWNFFGF